MKSPSKAIGKSTGTTTTKASRGPASKPTVESTAKSARKAAGAPVLKTVRSDSAGRKTMGAGAGGSTATNPSPRTPGDASAGSKVAQTGSKGAKSAAPAASTKSAPGRSGGKAAARRSAKADESAHHITPEEALENTRNLLAAKQERARQAPPWQAHDTHPAGHAPDAGFESTSARDRAADLHEGEMRLNANEGSISNQDRHQQGKRDSR